jgi:hypothetical protein
MIHTSTPVWEPPVEVGGSTPGSNPTRITALQRRLKIPGIVVL